MLRQHFSMDSAPLLGYGALMNLHDGPRPGMVYRTIATDGTALHWRLEEQWSYGGSETMWSVRSLETGSQASLDVATAVLVYTPPEPWRDVA